MNFLTKSIVFVCLVSLSNAQCPEGRNCTECEYMSGKYEIFCAKNGTDYGYTVIYKPYDYLKITCHNPYTKWLDFHLGYANRAEDVKRLTFRLCPLPRCSFLGDIAKQVLVEDVEELDFRSSLNRTIRMSRDCFKKFNKVKRLSLSDNILAGITSDLLIDLEHLRVLNLRMNNIQHLPDNFLITPNLEAIELGMNKISKINKNIFGKLSKLKLLNLWDNNIEEIEAGTFDEFSSLISIDIHSNKLQTLPVDLFSRLTQLQVINLAKNNFSTTTLPEYLLTNNKKLEKFKFSENQQNMETFPNNFFKNLTNLMILDISRNGLMYLPNNLFLNVTSLKNLDLQRNYLQTLPQKLFQDCKNLSSIVISFNNITHLPDGIFKGLIKLEELNLSNNFIVTISEYLFRDLSYLKILNIERNKLQKIHSQSLLAFHNLRIAKFSHNQLSLTDAVIYEDEYGPRSPFHYTSESIQELHLANNNISVVFADWIFSTHLRYLNLSRNNVKILLERNFQFITNELSLDLRQNNIQKILFNNNYYEPVLQTKNKLKKITILLDDNPLICDCQIYQFLCYLESSTYLSPDNILNIKMDNLLCKEPDWLYDKHLVDLSSKSLKCLIDEPHNLNATCPDKCECWIRPENRAYLIDCSSKNLTQAPKLIKAPDDYFIEINLSKNYLTNMPPLDRYGYEKVTVMLLSYNHILNIPIETLSMNIRVLSLHDNHLKTIDPRVLTNFKNSKNLINLTLHNNKWSCDCNDRNFLQFIQTEGSRLRELQKVTCGEKNIKVYLMTSDEICPTTIDLIIGSCIGISSVGIIIAILTVLYYRYEHKIRIWLYSKKWCLRWITEDEIDKNKKYDAFISYSHVDDDFVVNNIVSRLESQPKPFKLCVHYRDWPAGEWIPNQVTYSVQNSRRTIVVLSKNFLKSEWGKMEFRTAHCQAIKDGRTRVIVIIYGDIPPTEELDKELKNYLKMNTYVKWGDPWFWEKLLYTLPHDSYINKKNKKCVKQKNGCTK